MCAHARAACDVWSAGGTKTKFVWVSSGRIYIYIYGWKRVYSELLTCPLLKFAVYSFSSSFILSSTSVKYPKLDPHKWHHRWKSNYLRTTIYIPADKTSPAARACAHIIATCQRRLVRKELRIHDDTFVAVQLPHNWPTKATRSGWRILDPSTNIHPALLTAVDPCTQLGTNLFYFIFIFTL